MQKKIILIGLALILLAMFTTLITLIPIIGYYSLVLNALLIMAAKLLLKFSLKNSYGKVFAIIVFVVTISSAGFGIWSNFIKDNTVKPVNWGNVDEKLNEKAVDNRPKGDSLNKEMDDLENSLGK